MVIFRSLLERLAGWLGHVAPRKSGNQARVMLSAATKWPSESDMRPRPWSIPWWPERHGTVLLLATVLLLLAQPWVEPYRYERAVLTPLRSEERRVGKECRFRGPPD